MRLVSKILANSCGSLRRAELWIESALTFYLQGAFEKDQKLFKLINSVYWTMFLFIYFFNREKNAMLLYLPQPPRIQPNKNQTKPHSQLRQSKINRVSRLLSVYSESWQVGPSFVPCLVSTTTWLSGMKKILSHPV